MRYLYFIILFPSLILSQIIQVSNNYDDYITLPNIDIVEDSIVLIPVNYIGDFPIESYQFNLMVNSDLLIPATSYVQEVNSSIFLNLLKKNNLSPSMSCEGLISTNLTKFQNNHSLLMFAYASSLKVASTGVLLYLPFMYMNHMDVFDLNNVFQIDSVMINGKYYLN